MFYNWPQPAIVTQLNRFEGIEKSDNPLLQSLAEQGADSLSNSINLPTQWGGQSPFIIGVSQRVTMNITPHRRTSGINDVSSRREDSANRTLIEIYGGEPYEYVPIGKHIVRAVGVCGGRPTFKYTRVEVAGVLDRLVGGASVDEIAEGFNGYISRDAIVEALTITIQSFVSCHTPDTSPT